MAEALPFCAVNVPGDTMQFSTPDATRVTECGYCGSTAPDDSRGNCGACGGPRLAVQGQAEPTNVLGQRTPLTDELAVRFEALTTEIGAALAAPYQAIYDRLADALDR